MKCGHPKDIDQFPWRDRARGIRKRYCRECQQNYHGNWIAENRERAAADRHARRKSARKTQQQWLRDYKDGKSCAYCGVSYPHFVLDFDHREPTEKDFNVAEMITGSHSLARIRREIAKCDLVCANCHRVRTYSKKDKASDLRVTRLEG